MPWGELRREIASRGRNIALEAATLKQLTSHFKSHGFPQYRKTERHGSAGQVKHVREGKLIGPYVPTNTIFSLDEVKSPFSYLKIPNIEGMGMVTSMEGRYERTFKDPISSQRELVYELKNKGGIKSQNFLGPNHPERIPADLLTHLNNPVTQAIKQARQRAQRELSDYGDERIWLSALGNIALLSYSHKMLHKVDGSPIDLKIGSSLFNTNGALAYVVFDGMDISTQRKFVRLDINELVVGVSTWISSTWLLPLPFKVKGYLKLESNKLTYNLQIKHAMADDSKYRPLNFTGLPREVAWQAPSQQALLSQISRNIQVMLSKHFPDLLNLADSYTKNITPRSAIYETKSESADKAYQFFKEVKPKDLLLEDEILEWPLARFEEIGEDKVISAALIKK